MLFARLQGQRIRRFTVAIEAAPDEPPRDAAHVRRRCGDEADVRTTIGHGNAERLPFTDRDLRAPLGRRNERTERHRFCDHTDEYRSGSLDNVARRLRRYVERTEEVRILYDDGREAFVCEQRFERGEIRHAVRIRQLFDVEFEPARVRLQDGAVIGMDGRGDENRAAPSRVDGHDRAFGEGRRTIVDRRVCDIEAGQ